MFKAQLSGSGANGQLSGSGANGQQSPL